MFVPVCCCDAVLCKGEVGLGLCLVGVGCFSVVVCVVGKGVVVAVVAVSLGVAFVGLGVRAFLGILLLFGVGVDRFSFSAR